MYQVLEELNKTSGITGSMIVGKDGIVIAADLDTSFEEETVGALAASIISIRVCPRLLVMPALPY